MELWKTTQNKQELYWEKKKIEPFPPTEEENLFDILKKHIDKHTNKGVWYIVFSKEEEGKLSEIASMLLPDNPSKAYSLLSAITRLFTNAYPNYITEAIGEMPEPKDRILAITFGNYTDQNY